MVWEVTGLHGQESKRARNLVVHGLGGQGVVDHQPCLLVVQGFLLHLCRAHRGLRPGRHLAVQAGDACPAEAFWAFCRVGHAPVGFQYADVWDVTGLHGQESKRARTLWVMKHTMDKESWITSSVLWWFRGPSFICAELTAVVARPGLLAVQAGDV
jgi:hypothetical protein